MGTINVFLRAASTNTTQDISRLLTKLGVTGTPAAGFAITVAANDDDRIDALAQNIANDPNVATIVSIIVP